MIALIGVGILVLAAMVFGLYKFLGKKPKKALRAGDYVMFKSKYKIQFPGVPTSHALVIEKIENDQAIVVFMTTKNQILREVVPLYTLSKAV